MTDEPMVERLERLEREATPGPWRWEGLGDHGFPQRVYGRNADPSDGTYPLVVMESYWGDADTPPPDTELIVAMRNAFPALLSQLREQEEREQLAVDTAYDAGRTSMETWAVECCARADAAERTVREQREVIEAAKDAVTDAIEPGRFIYCDNLARCQCSTARLFRSVAALAPDTEGNGT